MNKQKINKNNSPAANIESKIVRWVSVAQWIACWTSNRKTMGTTHPFCFSIKSQGLAIRTHFSHCADENILAQTIILSLVVYESKVIVIMLLLCQKSYLMLILVDNFQSYAAYNVPFVENRADLMLTSGMLCSEEYNVKSN
ncbi:hypothetical protein TNCV_3862201 [Trichonephila clavipes]|nr:hypothetical protein TNCV_3862201 [Trichonephila clavipes]